MIIAFRMSSNLSIRHRIESVRSEAEFETMAELCFEHQLKNNAPYRDFVHSVHPDLAFDFGRPPFLPIELFKHHRVSCEPTEEVIFKSSGTTGAERSEHAVFDLGLYDELAIAHFEMRYGLLSKIKVLALLPSYLENGDSSLVHMADRFIAKAARGSGFVLSDPEKLKAELKLIQESGESCLLIGVSYALLDLADEVSLDIPSLTIMETGGMKGRRKEMTRVELHTQIKKSFPLSNIHSEYGMTELLSHAYFGDDGVFTPAPWMKAYTTDISDPLNTLPTGQRGCLAFIDLANYHSCSFIQTQDIGVVHDDGTFSVEGRLDRSDLRGCNLLYT